jgi:hypothetical protein
VHLVPHHGKAQAFLARDQVVVVVLSQVDLHPVDDPVEDACLSVVVGCDSRAALPSNVGSPSSAEKMNGWVRSTRPSPTFSPS